MFANSLYLAENIEMPLKQAFGSNKSILDQSYTTSIGARIGVIAITIQDSSLYIFTNYNGVGKRSQNLGIFINFTIVTEAYRQ